MTHIDEQAEALGADGDVLVLVVTVHERRLGILAADVAELLRVVEHAVLPDAPAFVEGVINVRGTVVAVLDLRSRLGLPYRAPALTDHLVLARVGSRLTAFRVDRAADLVQVSLPELRAATAIPAAAPLLGAATLPGGLLLIHDLARFLSATEAADLDRAMSTAADS